MPVRQITSRLTPRGWAILGGATIAGILFIYLFVHTVSKPSYATIATGLEPAQTGKMTSALDQQGIGYELQNNGTALAVQSNETAQARVALSSAGLLGNAQPGFKLFEKSSLGESNFQQQVTYQRALQGQLEQTIDNVQGVSGAQVELVLPNPQNQLFGEGQTASSAAVLLSGTSSLSPASVRGIAQLVASSVPGLQLQKVTITDGTGQLLWPAQNGEAGGGATGKQAAQERYDDQVEASLDEMLAQTLGPGKAEVQVYATLNTNQTTKESLTYGKAGVPLQQSKNLETLTGSGGGTTGTANIPAYAQTGASGKSNYKHEVTGSTLGVDKTVEHSTVAPGEVESQHVSVLLDHSVPAASIPAIKEAVTNAAGIQAKRGDTVSIGQMAFAKQAAPAGEGATGGIMGDAKYALIGIASLVFLFFATRGLRKREREGIDNQPPWLRELELPVRLSELQRESVGTPGDGGGRQPMPALAAAGAGGGAGGPDGGPVTVRRQVENLAQSNPDRVAQQVRTWMQED
ncbi:MAG TPA: flagellar basal-body MS-ring/collar protein FliF [Solirubrobacteraceae bacterium]|jgi:flagellar M-ring protein FliF|nr:flagellar basal-body MS-ring/collar protein FliF [Solirubrobacteraceae bacterium]